MNLLSLSLSLLGGGLSGQANHAAVPSGQRCRLGRTQRWVHLLRIKSNSQQARKWCLDGLYRKAIILRRASGFPRIKYSRSILVALLKHKRLGRVAASLSRWSHGRNAAILEGAQQWLIVYGASEHKPRRKRLVSLCARDKQSPHRRSALRTLQRGLPSNGSSQPSISRQCGRTHSILRWGNLNAGLLEIASGWNKGIAAGLGAWS